MLAALALALAPHVLTVTDAAGGGGYTSLQSAVDAALDGDTILIDLPIQGSPRLAGAVIYDKALLIQGITPGPDGCDPEVGVPIGPLRISGLSLGKTITLRALDVEAGHQAGHGSSAGLGVESSAGTVRVERCHLSAPEHYATAPAVELDLALDVTMVDCYVGGSIVAGIRARRSRLSAIDTIVTAGLPEINVDPGVGFAVGNDGAPALLLESRSFAWLGDCQIEGGTGGGAYCLYVHAGCDTTGGNGGPGVQVEPGSLCAEVGSTVLGGRPGHPDYGASGYHSWGMHGPAIVGPVTRIPGSQRRLTVPEVVQGGAQVHGRFDGLPGEEVWILGGRVGGHRYLGWQWGVLQVNGPYDLAPTLLGVIPETGSLEAAFSLPDLGVDLSRTISLQAYFRSAPNRYRLSEVQDITVVSPLAPNFERQTVLHVDASAPPGGDGRSWATAYGSLALAVADPQSTQEDSRFPPEIWMAGGTYIQGEQFLVERSLSVYGGFRGDETQREQRDPVLFPTWLDGDVEQNDSMGISSDNSEGLLFVLGGFSSIISTRFNGLSFRGSRGASAFNAAFARVSVEACRWQGNHASFEDVGGAMWVLLTDTSQFGSRPLLPELVIRRCHFYDNSGPRAGAVAVSPPTGIFPMTPLPHIQLHCTDSVFSGNLATGLDGLGASYGGSITLNSTSNGTAFEATLVGNTFFENERPAAAAQVLHLGGLHVQPEHRVQFVNNICWSSLGGAGDSFVTGMGDAGDRVHHNCMHALPGPLGGTPSNFMAPPRFRDTRGPDGMAGTGDEDLRPALTSPCVDSGDQRSLSPLSAFDILGEPRVVDQAFAPGASVDLGAFEVL